LWIGDGFDGKLKPSFAAQLSHHKNENRLERERVALALQRRGMDTGTLKSDGPLPIGMDSSTPSLSVKVANSGAAGSGSGSAGTGNKVYDKSASSSSLNQPATVGGWQKGTTRENLRAMLHSGVESGSGGGGRSNVMNFAVAEPTASGAAAGANNSALNADSTAGGPPLPPPPPRPLYDSLQVEPDQLLPQIQKAQRILKQLSQGHWPHGHDEHIRHSLPINAMSDYHRSLKSSKVEGGNFCKA